MIKTFPASLDKLYDMLNYIKELSVEVGFDDVNVSKIELACEEALVNIISYGYPKDRGDIEIICETLDKKGIKITFKDHGIPYNPLTNARKIDEETSTPVGEPTLGGYGIFFILQLMDEVEYQRENNSNNLYLTKFL